MAPKGNKLSIVLRKLSNTILWFIFYEAVSTMIRTKDIFEGCLKKFKARNSIATLTIFVFCLVMFYIYIQPEGLQVVTKCKFATMWLNICSTTVLIWLGKVSVIFPLSGRMSVNTVAFLSWLFLFLVIWCSLLAYICIEFERRRRSNQIQRNDMFDLESLHLADNHVRSNNCITI